MRIESAVTSLRRPTYPAALRDVVGVAAVGPDGPAPFTNYGPWVRACAPGVDVVSRFFTTLDRTGPSTGRGDPPVPGPDAPAPGIPDPVTLTGWAQWSGTSFAAPTVVAALANEMARWGVDARQAVHRIIDAPTLLRIPDLGTVVNVA